MLGLGSFAEKRLEPRSKECRWRQVQIKLVILAGCACARESLSFTLVSGKGAGLFGLVVMRLVAARDQKWNFAERVLRQGGVPF